MKTKCWKVSGKEKGVKLLVFIRGHLDEEYSSRQLKQLIDANYCKIDGKTERFSSTVLMGGETVELTFPEIEKASSKIYFDKALVLFEDEFFLIYDKPSGIVSDDDSFLKALKRQGSFLKLIHRLDRETSGALIFAKTSAAAAKMEELFKKREVFKRYFAIVDGIPKKQKGRIKNYLIEKKRYHGQVVWGESNDSTGLEAITEWKVERKGKQVSLLECSPKTGRTHQIRVHLSGIGHPILGDFQYGGSFRSQYRPKRMLLHAYSLSFMHPMTLKMMEIKSAIPTEFKHVISELFGEES